MSKHKWYHFIATQNNHGSFKKTLMDPQRTVTKNYELSINKCSICKEWKVTITDYKHVKVLGRPWEPMLDSIAWLKENNYDDLL
jgi:hypothetical protein